MSYQLFLGLLLSILPLFELRGGLPLVIDYALKNNLSIIPYFFLVLILNIGVVFFIFLFLDYIHHHLIKFEFYKKSFGKLIEKFHVRAHKTKSSFENIGYVALTLFVAIPFPGTGAWGGSLISWILDLDRVKSFIAISIGVIIAGTLVLFGSLGLFRLLY